MSKVDELMALADELLTALARLQINGPQAFIAAKAEFRSAIESALAEAQAPKWLPMEWAPRDGRSLLVPPDGGYTHCFWLDGFWWWHNVHSGQDGDYAVGPEPKGWLPPAPEVKP